MRLIGLLLLTVLQSCGWLTPDLTPRSPDEKGLAELRAKRNYYCDLAAERYAKKSYVTVKCDALIYTALFAIACPNVDVRIDDFHDAGGRWYRDPNHECAPGEGSRSTISNDGILGMGLYAVSVKRPDLLEMTLDYEKSAGSLGDCNADQPGNCKLWPSLRYVFKDYLKTRLHLGYDIDLIKGFRAHLLVLHILLNERVYGGISKVERELLRREAKQSPNNALFSAMLHRYTDNDMSHAVHLLLNPAKFPPTSLPTNANYCTEYLYATAETKKDWAPCDKKLKHDGIDFLFAAAVVLGLPKE